MQPCNNYFHFTTIEIFVLMLRKRIFFFFRLHFCWLISGVGFSIKRTNIYDCRINSTLKLCCVIGTGRCARIRKSMKISLFLDSLSLLAMRPRHHSIAIVNSYGKSKAPQPFYTQKEIIKWINKQATFFQYRHRQCFAYQKSKLFSLMNLEIKKKWVCRNIWNGFSISDLN